MGEKKNIGGGGGQRGGRGMEKGRGIGKRDGRRGKGEEVRGD